MAAATVSKRMLHSPASHKRHSSFCFVPNIEDPLQISTCIAGLPVSRWLACASHAYLDTLCVKQAQSLEGMLSNEQVSHAETNQQLEGYREMLAVADATKRQLGAQVADLQIQHANSQAASQAAQDKLAASETELAQVNQDVQQLQQQVNQAKLWHSCSPYIMSCSICTVLQRHWPFNTAPIALCALM